MTESDVTDSQADPDEVRQALNDIAATYKLMLDLVKDVEAIADWMRQRISGAVQHQEAQNIEEAWGYLSQIKSILQGYRDDQLLMRHDIRELRAAIELALGQLPYEPPRKRITAADIAALEAAAERGE